MKMYNPPHPGEIIKEFWIDSHILTIDALAYYLDESPIIVQRLITGKMNINANLALKLGKLIGKSPETWLYMQNCYDLWIAEKNVDLDKVRVVKIK